MDTILKCKVLSAGYGQGTILATHQSISFWGGVDPATGVIVDPRHELFNQSITAKVLAFPYGKGSAAAPLILLELIKQGTAPVAIVNMETDPLLVAGPIIGRHFYNRAKPVVCLDHDSFVMLKTGKKAIVDGERREVVIPDMTLSMGD
jgi:predicted aconitase with swiveling domain